MSDSQGSSKELSKLDCSCGENCERKGRPFPTEWPWRCKQQPFIQPHPLAREPPHCSTCACGLSHEPPDDQAVACALKHADSVVGDSTDALALRRLAEAVRAAQPPGALPQQADVLQWAINSFGPIAKNRDERAARLAEEAIEVAQAEGVSLEIVQRIAARVYSRPPGELWQELGGLAITALAFADNVELSFSECAQSEWQRVLSKPRDWWQRKHAEKVAAGTADLSPALTKPDEQA